MNDEITISDALSLDTYVIGKPIKFSFNEPYCCYDSTGTRLFDVKAKLLSG